MSETSILRESTESSEVGKSEAQLVLCHAVVALTSLRALWQNVPPSWNGFGDPCGDRWDGVVCAGSRVTAM